MAQPWYVFISLADMWIVRSYEKPILLTLLAYWIVYLLSIDSMALKRVKTGFIGDFRPKMIPTYYQCRKTA
jgi:hypothetical protein